MDSNENRSQHVEIAYEPARVGRARGARWGGGELFTLKGVNRAPSLNDVTVSNDNAVVTTMEMAACGVRSVAPTATGCTANAEGACGRAAERTEGR